MADSYKVLRLFPASITLRRGQVLSPEVTATWRNLPLLVKQGYLEKAGNPARSKKEVPDTDDVKMADANRPDMIEVDRPHVEHPEVTSESPALAPTEDVEVVHETNEAFIPDDVAAPQPAPKKAAPKKTAQPKKKIERNKKEKTSGK